MLETLTFKFEKCDTVVIEVSATIMVNELQEHQFLAQLEELFQQYDSSIVHNVEFN